MVYSCRAECGWDVDEFLCRAGAQVRLIERRRLIYIHGKTEFVDPASDIETPSRAQGVYLPDVAIEFESSLDLSVLLMILQSIEDTHVMQESLRKSPLTENTLNRDPVPDMLH